MAHAASHPLSGEVADEVGGLKGSLSLCDIVNVAPCRAENGPTLDPLGAVLSYAAMK
jgi:hypothetical protein